MSKTIYFAGLVQSAVQTLVYHGVVTLIPVFLYTNMYAIKPDIVNLSKDRQMQEECVRYVASEPKEGAEEKGQREKVLDPCNYAVSKKTLFDDNYISTFEVAKFLNYKKRK